MRRASLVGAGGVLAAFLGSLCCVGPLLFVSLGVGAGLASAFEPLRPYFGVGMLVLFALGFWTVYGRNAGAFVDRASAAGADGGPTPAHAPVCTPDGACAVPVRRRRDVVVLWTAAVLAVVLWTFPSWSLWFL